MRRLFLATAALSLLAAPAFAARVTNLDEVAHTVVFENAGSAVEHTIVPNQTAIFPRMDGIIGLKGGTPTQSTLTSDGVLQGVIGAARTGRIPTGPYDDFVIWKGGKMTLQRRQKSAMGN